MQEVLDEFDIIECFELPGRQLQVGETTKRQMDLYTKLGIMPPASLHLLGKLGYQGLPMEIL
jgi:hypothetical protein